MKDGIDCVSRRRGIAIGSIMSSGAVVICIVMALWAAPLQAQTLSPEWRHVPATNALMAIQDPAEWTEAQGAVVGTGNNWPWSWIVRGDAAAKDYRLDAVVEIQKAAAGGGDAREVADPRDGRYRYWAGAYMPGYDAALMIRYTEPWHAYRVMLSVKGQEIVLWKQFGGTLQVAPCEIKVGAPYKVSVEALGPHITVSVNGEKKLDYWDRCLPELSGKVGLGVYASNVSFREVSQTPLAASTAVVPPHKPNFIWRKWRGERWIFDGSEPILQWDTGKSQSVFVRHVKLRPGYRPSYFTWVCWKFYSGNSDAVLSENEAVDTSTPGALKIRYKTVHLNTKIAVDHTFTPAYDAENGVYRYVVESAIAAPDKALNITAMDPEFTDIYTYNNKFPDKGVSHPWPFAGHIWHVGLANGQWRRAPIHQELSIEGNGGFTDKHDVNADGGFFVYPDIAACPAVFTLNKEMPWYESTCIWGTDYHCRSPLFGGSKEVPPGSVQQFNYVLTAIPPAKAEEYFKSSVLYSAYQRPENADPRSFPWEYPVWKPLFNDFRTLSGIQEPHFDAAVGGQEGKPYVGSEYYYIKDHISSLDRTVGHGDTQSLVLNGPGTLGTTVKEYQQETFAEKYLFSAWVKTKDVKGNGVAFRSGVVWYHNRADAGKSDTLPVGLTGTHDWTKVNWVTPIFHDTEGCTINLDLDGSGTMWVDDVELRPLKPGETVTSTPAAAWKAADEELLLDLPMDEGSGIGLYDWSGNRQYGRLWSGCSWVKDGDRWVVSFNGKSPSGTVVRKSGLSERVPNDPAYHHQRWLKPGFALEMWVKPSAQSANAEQWLMHDRLSFELTLTGKSAPYGIRAASQNEGGDVKIVVSPSIPADKWTRIVFVQDWQQAKKAQVFVDGKLAGEATVSGPIWFFNYKNFYGLGHLFGSAGGGYSGLMRNVRIWGKTVTGTN